MATKITHVEIIPVKIALSETFVISKGPLNFATITIVKVFTSDGTYGIGECCPYRTIHTETLEGTIAKGKLIAQLIIGEDPTQIRRLMSIMDQSISGHASIKAAYDMALYDLNAKMVNLPLYRYLNGDPNKRMTTNMTVSLLDKEAMVQKATEYINRGFNILKIKLGSPSSTEDVDRIRLVREAVGSEISISIDANQGWNYLQAKSALEAIQNMGIKYCEAPIHSSNHRHLRQLRSVSPIPIMGDETVFNHKDAYQMLADNCIDMINIKLGKSGGICHAMKIASIAHAAGVHCQVGCFSESRLGISALVHFAMAWENILYFDLDSPLMHSEDPIQGGITYRSDWSVGVSDAPGLGADYDPLFLKKFDSIIIKAS